MRYDERIYFHVKVPLYGEPWNEPQDLGTRKLQLRKKGYILKKVCLLTTYTEIHISLNR